MTKAIRLHATGGAEVLKYEEVDVGEPGAGEARVRHSFIAVNFADIYFRTGFYRLELPNGLGTDEKAAVAKANGCAHTIVTSREDIAKRVLEITEGKGVSVVHDSVGKDTLEASLACLQTRGTLLSNGTSSGPVILNVKALGARSIWFTRPAMRHCIEPRTHMLDMARELFDHVLAGRIVSEPKQSFALADAADAHRALEGRKTVGSTVLVP